MRKIETGFDAICFWKYNPEFMQEMVDYLKGKRVLEIFGGNGYLASLLNEQGIEITSTSLRSGHDGHQIKMFFEVEEIEAVDAVEKYKDTHDVLLMSWPTVTPRALMAVKAWGKDRPVFYIGEVTDYSKHHLGGCATDEFFEAIRVERELNSYIGNMLEHAQILKLR